MSVIVHHAGMHSMLVDSGREFHRSSGIAPCGPMDPFAYQVGNYLVGNDQPATAIEFFQSGPELEFMLPTLVAITGPGSGGLLDGKKVMAWRPIFIEKGSILRLSISGEGAVGYLNIHGGWKSQHWLGSGTTHLAARIGGHEGRLLMKNDELIFKTEIKGHGNPADLNWNISENELYDIYSREKHISCIRGPENEIIDSALSEKFVSQPFRISSKSNRMGYRLSGEHLTMNRKIEMISSPVDFGTIQLLPDGQLAVLMADHQTTGGYPRLATVIRTDFPRLAQFSRSRDLYFSWCTPETAYGLLNDRHQKLRELKNSCFLRLKQYLH